MFVRKITISLLAIALFGPLVWAQNVQKSGQLDTKYVLDQLDSRLAKKALELKANDVIVDREGAWTAIVAEQVAAIQSNNTLFDEPLGQLTPDQKDAYIGVLLELSAIKRAEDGTFFMGPQEVGAGGTGGKGGAPCPGCKLAQITPTIKWDCPPDCPPKPTEE